MFSPDPETIALVIFGLLVLGMGLITFGATSGRSKRDVEWGQICEEVLQSEKRLGQLSEWVRLCWIKKLTMLPLTAAEHGLTEEEFRELYRSKTGKDLPTLDEFFEK